MKKLQQFKRTAFCLNAMSWASTLLLLIAMLVPQGAWAQYISEIKVSVDEKDGSTAKNKLTNDGFKVVERDLNAGGGGYYVYIGYKTTTDVSKAITDLLIVESSTTPQFDAHAIDNITNANVTYKGKKYYRCENYTAKDARLDCDLNRGRTGNPDIVLFYTTDGNTEDGGTPLTSISTADDTLATNVIYTRHWKYATSEEKTTEDEIKADKYGNANGGCKSPHYITYTTHTHAYSSYTTTATEHDAFCSCGLQLVDDEHHQNVNGKCSVCSYDLKDWTFFYKTKSGNAITPSMTPDFGATLLSNNYVDGQGYMNFDGPITRFNDKVFVNLTDLTGSLVIPNSVTSIGTKAFERCTGLNGTLTLGSSLKSIGNYAFYYCSNLTGDLTIPNSVTSIGESAFNECSGFNGKLTLSNTLSSIGAKTFRNCQNLTGALTIPNTLKSIPNYAFYYCSKLTSVTFHNSLTSIGESAFGYCTAFTGTLTIPASVTSIGAKAFSYTKFSTIRNERTTPQTYNMIFGIVGGANFVNTPVKSMKLEVPSSAVAAYRAAAGWNEFKSIVCISHNFNQQNTDVAYAKDPVTCTKAGTYYYSCSVCGEKSTNSTFTVAALQHDYSVMSTDEAYHKDDATCLSAATYWYKCSRCTAKSTKDFFTSTEDKDKALGHSYGEGVWSWKWDDEEHSATCTRTCTRTTCTDKTTGHTASAKVTQNNGIDDGELTQPATCAAMGTTTYTATAIVENVEYKSTNEVADIAMLPQHTWRANYYVWSRDDHYYHKECQICNKLDESMAFCRMFGEYYNIEEKQSVTLPLAKVGSYYYTSVSTDFPYTVNEGVEVYQIWEVEDGKVKLVKRSPDQIVGKTSVIIRSKTASECTLTYDPYGLEMNDEKIVHSSPTIISNPEPNMYVFSLSDTGLLGFWNWEGMTIPAWKPYIQIDDPSAAKGLTLVFVDEDGTTSVEQIPVKAPAAEGSYDLMGRKVKAVKGFGIVNGKKVYVR
ncbi:MAG: leucine-rich repeat domain-containing protein [Bacteroidaceae bacterium]|nr:leucine-rich repeat domain-containing protein [Bacteroidaceae bacterium]